MTLEEIERDYGEIVKVKGKSVYLPPLPDWNLAYVEIDDDMQELRRLLMAAKARIVKVTDQRIYFEDERLNALRITKERRQDRR